MIKQRTLQRIAQIAGVGIHSGSAVSLQICPAPEDTGIVFRRVDQDPVLEISALTDHVQDTRLNSSLGKSGITIATVEHLLSAFAGLGIDNAYINLTQAEIPVMDGSAAPFADLFQSVGLVEQSAPKHFFRIIRPISVQEGDQWVRLEPYSGSRFSVAIDYPHPIIASSNQQIALELTPEVFCKEIAPARTFGFLADYEYLRTNRLALGASLENTVVLSEEGIVNQEGLRYADEFVRHKLLDVIGDLYLLGHNIIGAFYGYKSGHRLNHQLRQAFLADTQAWELVTSD